jgi:hypothetical protein
MYGAEEYYSRPRFRGTDDILQLMAGGTSQAVDTINRTGDSLARSNADKAREIGDAFRNIGAMIARKREDRRLRERQEKFDTEHSEEHTARMKQFGTQQEAADLDLKAKKAEESYLDEDASSGDPTKPREPGGWISESLISPAASNPPNYVQAPTTTHTGTRRQQLLADKMKLSGLGITQAEEGIKTQQHTRDTQDKTLTITEKQLAATMAQLAASERRAAAAEKRMNEQWDLQKGQINEEKAAQAIGAALSQNPNQGIMGAGQMGPPGQLDQIGQQYHLDPTRLGTLTQQQRLAQAKNARDQSMIDITMNPTVAPIQEKLVALENQLGSLAGVTSAVSDLDKVDFMHMRGDDYANKIQAVKAGLAGADPVLGPRMAQQIGGTNFNMTGFNGGEQFFEGPATQGKKAAFQIINQQRAQATQLLAEAKNTGNMALIQKANAILAGIDNSFQVLQAGGNPNTHNTFQPMPQPQANPFQPQQPRPMPVRYDGRG